MDAREYFIRYRTTRAEYLKPGQGVENGPSDASLETCIRRLQDGKAEFVGIFRLYKDGITATKLENKMVNLMIALDPLP